jgi:hypothetical protein
MSYSIQAGPADLVEVESEPGEPKLAYVPVAYPDHFAVTDKRTDHDCGHRTFDAGHFY